LTGLSTQQAYFCSKQAMPSAQASIEVDKKASYIGMTFSPDRADFTKC
jgi:hypothetical protein